MGSSVGKYRVLALAGRGGMGTVWKAEDSTLGRVVALKFLPESQTSSPTMRRRFVREARIAGKLDHPGIATVYESGDFEGEPFIAFQWVDGETIADLVSRGPLASSDALSVARDAAEALAYAHHHGVLHRDISARNIMVCRDGRTMILDFGLSLATGSSRITSSSSTLGTTPYLSPELVLGSASSEQSDVYALGVVLHQMLAGALPFDGERAEAILYAVVNEPLDTSKLRQAGVAPAIERLVTKVLARDPSARHASARALADALAEFDAEALHRLPATPAAGAAQRAPRPRRTAGGRTVISDTGPRYLVVQPFRDLQADAPGGEARRFFALGVTETVSAQLARYPGILVVSPTVDASSSAALDARALAQASGADLVLHGSIQHSADRLRITFALLDPLQGVEIAGDVLDGALSEIFMLQDLLARRVADALRPGAALVTALLDRTGLHAVAAQERFLQALGYLQRFDNEAHVDGAITLLNELSHGGNDSAVVEAALGRAALYKYQMTHDREWAARAEAACGRALEMDARSADVLLTLGNLQRVLGRFTEAERSFRRALKLRPDHPEALTGLARALEGANKLAEAEQIYLRALALRPNHWEPYHLLGGFYFNQGRYDDSIRLWRRVLELTPDNARAFNNLGAAYFRLERFEEAIEASNRAISIRPEASAYSNLGTVHYFLGRWAESAAMFEKAVALRPQLPRLWGNLGDAYRRLPGRESDAAAAYDRAIELMRGELGVNPRSAEGLGWLAEWAVRRGDAREAERLVRRALKLAPGDVNVMARAVNVFHLAEDRAETLKWLEAALTAGYGLAEFERDPDLGALREDVGYKNIVSSFTAARSGRIQGSHTDGEPGRNTERGACS